MSDSTRFDMTDVPLDAAMKIAFFNAPGGKATHYKQYDDKLVFAWHESAGKDWIPFLIPLTAETAVQVVRDWVDMTAKFGKQPDHDGDNDKSCRIYCEAWGLVDHNQYAFVAIAPAWAMYGK